MSTIKVGTLLAADGSTTTQPSIPALDKRMAKAWVNFNGTGTVAIRDSYNVSSVVTTGNAQFKVNFSTNMSSVNFCAFVTARGVAASSRGLGTLNHDLANTISAVNVLTLNAANGDYVDSPEVNVMIIED